MTGQAVPLSGKEIWAIGTRASERCRSSNLTVDQAVAAAELAVDLYAMAATHGVNPDVADGVTSFIDDAIDAIRARDYRSEQQRSSS